MQDLCQVLAFPSAPQWNKGQLTASTTWCSSWLLWADVWLFKLSEHLKKSGRWPLKPKRSWAALSLWAAYSPLLCPGAPWPRGTALLSQGHSDVKFISHSGLSLFSSVLQNDKQNQNHVQLKEREWAVLLANKQKQFEIFTSKARQ